ncbi:hypothetical protein [Sporosarcina sp. FSL K6-2383]|uniref:hypothetical protein n=1 Tax=Sporosarcina sp. FSL K6-2383 TaxID=2921556 RepID=UPI00315AE5FC
MPLEKEVVNLLTGGFIIVIGMAILTTLLLWLKTRNNSFAYTCTLLYFLLFSVSIYFFLKAISFDYNHPMASEEISLRIGISGVVWALGILCLMMGIVNFSKTKSSTVS